MGSGVRVGFGVVAGVGFGVGVTAGSGVGVAVGDAVGKGVVFSVFFAPFRDSSVFSGKASGFLPVSSKSTSAVDFSTGTGVITVSVLAITISTYLFCPAQPEIMEAHIAAITTAPPVLMAERMDGFLFVPGLFLLLRSIKYRLFK